MDVATLSSSAALVNPGKEFGRVEVFRSRSSVSFTGVEDVRVLRSGCR